MHARAQSSRNYSPINTCNAPERPQERKWGRGGKGRDISSPGCTAAATCKAGQRKDGGTKATGDGDVYVALGLEVAKNVRGKKKRHIVCA